MLETMSAAFAGCRLMGVHLTVSINNGVGKGSNMLPSADCMSCCGMLSRTLGTANRLDRYVEQV